MNGREFNSLRKDHKFYRGMDLYVVHRVHRNPRGDTMSIEAFIEGTAVLTTFSSWDREQLSFQRIDATAQDRS